MPRFYVNQQLTLQNDFRLPENVVRHIQVLRLRVGDELVLFNGDGHAYVAELSELEKRHAACHIIDKQQKNSESPLDLILVQAISSGDRMDFTLQKSVELGVNQIVPILSERCVVKLSGERADKRMARWQEIVISACEQCGRNTVPIVQPIVSLRDYLREKDERLHVLMSLNHAKSLREIAPPSHIALMIGPEGGWTAAEEQLAFQAGCQAITLGQRVLRTETASLAAIAAMQTLWGDFAP